MCVLLDLCVDKAVAYPEERFNKTMQKALNFYKMLVCVLDQVLLVACVLGSSYYRACIKLIMLVPNPTLKLR